MIPSLSNLLQELSPPKKWIELSAPQIQDYSTQLFALIDQAYKSIGGNLEIKSPSDITQGDLSFWIAADVDGDEDVDAVQAGKKTPFGTKITLGATDGSGEAKRFLTKKLLLLVRQKGFFIEGSHRISVLLERFQVPFLTNEDDIKKVLNKDIEYLGDGWYLRKIHGEVIKKRLYGNPKL